MKTLTLQEAELVIRLGGEVACNWCGSPRRLTWRDGKFIALRHDEVMGEALTLLELCRESGYHNLHLPDLSENRTT